MNRLRLLRLIVPAALVVFAAVVVIALCDRPAGTGGVPGGGAEGDDRRARLEGFTITDIVGDRRRLAVSARIGSWDDSGGFQADGIERIELDRDAGTPLIVSAARGRGIGAQGRRVIRLEGNVEIRDDENGLLVRIPSAELDQSAGFARSLGDVVIASPGISGSASSAVYPLDGRPTELYALELRDASGGVLRASRASLPRGGRIAQFEGDVGLNRGADVLFAERLRVERDAYGALRLAEAVGAVRGSSGPQDTPGGNFRATRADLAWTDGSLSRVVLTGEAVVEQGTRTVQANLIDMTRRGPGWDLSASGRVVVTGGLPSGGGRIEATSLQATLDASGAIERGRAEGGVKFSGKEAAGDGESAELVRVGPDERLTLLSSSGRRARLAAGRTRVIADTIVTTGRGSRLQAEGGVEATLLPDPGGAGTGRGTALFNGREAIHFVAARLETEDSGKVLRFRQNVRGWQADRNLAADEVDIDQRSDVVDARGRVNTRWPRSGGRLPAGGFLNVSSDLLGYRGVEGLAAYSGSVRARQEEGWIACGRLELTLAGTAGGLREIRGYEAVQFEFREPAGVGSATPEPVTGLGDRIVYAPEAGWVRLFGDRAPAELRRGGPNGGTTAGRVLRYALDTGQVEVESGSAERDSSARGTR